VLGPISKFRPWRCNDAALSTCSNWRSSSCPRLPGPMTATPGMTEMMDLYGICHHGGGPTRSILDEGEHWAEPDKVTPRMQFGLALPFFKNIKQNLSGTSPA
jgi:hypothetical protein